MQLLAIIWFIFTRKIDVVSFYTVGISLAIKHQVGYCYFLCLFRILFDSP